MSYLKWAQNLDVDVSKMSEAHIELIRLMNLLFDRNQSRATNWELNKIM